MAVSLPLLSAKEVYYLTIYGFTPALPLKPRAVEPESGWAYLPQVPSYHQISQHPGQWRLQNKLRRGSFRPRLYQQDLFCWAKHLSLLNIQLSPGLFQQLKKPVLPGVFMCSSVYMDIMLCAWVKRTIAFQQHDLLLELAFTLALFGNHVFWFCLLL